MYKYVTRPTEDLSTQMDDPPVGDSLKQAPENGLRNGPSWPSLAPVTSSIRADELALDAMDEDGFQSTTQEVCLQILTGDGGVCSDVTLLQDLQRLCDLFLDPLRRKEKDQCIDFNTCLDISGDWELDKLWFEKMSGRKSKTKLLYQKLSFILCVCCVWGKRNRVTGTMAKVRQS